MTSTVDVAEAPVATSSALTTSSKHLAVPPHTLTSASSRAGKSLVASMESCCPFRLKDLHQRCTKEYATYDGCLYYHTNKFDMCRKEQADFEQACPVE